MGKWGGGGGGGGGGGAGSLISRCIRFYVKKCKYLIIYQKKMTKWIALKFECTHVRSSLVYLIYPKGAIASMANGKSY